MGAALGMNIESRLTGMLNVVPDCWLGFGNDADRKAG